MSEKTDIQKAGEVCMAFRDEVENAGKGEEHTISCQLHFTLDGKLAGKTGPIEIGFFSTPKNSCLKIEKQIANS